MEKSLARKSAEAVKWNYVGIASRIACQFVAQIGLARLLGPEVLGTFGYAVLIYGVCGIFIEQGLCAALVRTGFEDDRTVRIVFWRILSVAAIFSTLTFVLAAPIARLMEAPQSAAAIRWFAPIYIAFAAGLVAQASLRRALRTKAIQVSQNLAYVIGYIGVGLSLALSGAGVFSLIAAYFVQTAIASWLMYRCMPHPVAPIAPFQTTSLGRYGRDIVSINLVNYGVDNAMGTYVARFFGAGPLGAFNIAFTLVKAPADHLVVGLQSVLFSAAALQRDLLRSRELYLVSLAAVTLVSSLIFVFVALVSQLLVDVLLGSAWHSVAGWLPPLALAMVCQTMASVAASIICARGDQKLELRAQITVGFAYALGLFVVRGGTEELLGGTVFAICLLRLCLLTAIAVRRLNIAWRDVAALMRGPLLLSLALTVTLSPLQHSQMVLGLTPLARLFICTAVAFCVCVGAIAAVPAWVIPFPLLGVAQLWFNRLGPGSVFAAWFHRAGLAEAEMSLTGNQQGSEQL